MITCPPGARSPLTTNHDFLVLFPRTVIDTHARMHACTRRSASTCVDGTHTQTHTLTHNGRGLPLPSMLTSAGVRSGTYGGATAAHLSVRRPARSWVVHLLRPSPYWPHWRPAARVHGLHQRKGDYFDSGGANGPQRISAVKTIPQRILLNLVLLNAQA